MEEPTFKVGDILRHKVDNDTCLITSIENDGTLFGHTLYGGNRGFLTRSSEEISPEYQNYWELSEESVVDKILTKYSNENHRDPH